MRYDKILHLGAEVSWLFLISLLSNSVTRPTVANHRLAISTVPSVSHGQCSRMKYSPPRRHRGVWQRAGGLHPLGWAEGETGNGELVDVAVECAALQQVPRDIVQPEALA